MKASIKDKMLLILGGAFLLALLCLLLFDLTRRGVYRLSMGINVVVVGESDMSILLLRPDEEMLGWVRLPKGTRVKVFNSEAHYPLESLWSYGVSEKRPYETVEKSLGQAMGVVISRTIKLADSSSIENVLGDLFSFSLKTNLSIRDRVMIRSFLADAVNSKKVLELTIPESVFDSVVDPDGRSFLEFNQTMTLWTKNKFVLEPILEENADISINNVSGVIGAGSVLSAQLESAGMHVVEVKADTEEKVTGKDCVYSSDKHFEMTELVLREQIGCSKITTPSFVEGDERLRLWIK
jgi:hypothetical protein